MKRIYLIISGCIATSMLQAQELSGQYTTEWQWDMNKNTNWVNQLRLDLSVPLGNDRNTIKAATLHLAQTGESVIGDWQGFSNIDADNMLASIAVLGFMHQWNSGHLFIGVRNVNEDFFTSPHHGALYQQFLWHFSHGGCQLSHSQLSLFGTHPLLRHHQKGMDVPQQPLQRHRLQWLDSPRQPVPDKTQDGRHLQHVADRVHPSQRRILCRHSCPHPTAALRHGRRNCLDKDSNKWNFSKWNYDR